MIFVDTVYQRVLALANKEQRGYITPQEFNLFAHQAQMEIFEQYFYDLDKWFKQHGNHTTYADMVTNIEQKISYFKRWDIDFSAVVGNLGDIRLAQNPQQEEIYRLLSVRVSSRAGEPLYIAEDVQVGEEAFLYQSSALARSTITRPTYWKRENLGDIMIRIEPAPLISTPFDPAIDGVVRISYIKTPTIPRWGYVVDQLGNALFDGSNSVDFELHSSDETELVYKILMLSGIAIQRDDITSAGQTLEKQQVQQEKQ